LLGVTQSDYNREDQISPLSGQVGALLGVVSSECQGHAPGVGTIAVNGSRLLPLSGGAVRLRRIFVWSDCLGSQKRSCLRPPHIRLVVMRIPLDTPEARVLAKALLRHHEHACRHLRIRKSKEVTDGMINRSVIPYGILCDRAGVPFLTHVSGKFLGEIAEWCYKNGWPPLNALAVRKDTGMPGEGYDGAAGCSLLKWPDEVRKCIAFGRYPASSSTGLVPASSSSAKRASSSGFVSALLTPGEIAKTLTPPESMRLCELVEGTWAQAFGVVKVQRLRKNVVVEVELEDGRGAVCSTGFDFAEIT
jgi:hypothetical protein